MTTFPGIWQTMVLEERMTQKQYENIKLSLSEQRKQSFLKHLKGKYSIMFHKNTFISMFIQIEILKEKKYEFSLYLLK
jgi:hypothetical protein